MAAKNRHKMRFWNDSYVQHGFTKVIGCDKLDNARCTLCNTILGKDSLKPSKLKRHQELKHKENTESVETFKAKRAHYDMKGTLPAFGFCLTSQQLLPVSYEVSLVIAKAKASQTAGEKLTKPSAVKIVQILLGRNEAKRIDSVPLSDDTVNNRIADIANDILSQLMAQIQDSSCKISLPCDETTDVKSISQLVAYVRFIKENAIVDEFLFCQEMEERTTVKDVFDFVNVFLRENSMAWNKEGLVCTDGAPAVIGHRSGFVAPLKQVASRIVSYHCAIQKYALACKTLSLESKSVIDSVVKAVDFIRGRAVNYRLFKAFCDDLGKEHQYLLFRTEMQWLSQEKVLSRVAELVTKVSVFFREHGSVELATLFDDNRFQLKVFIWQTSLVF